MTEKTNKVLSKGANDLVKALNTLKQLSNNVEAMSNEISSLDYQISDKERELELLKESVSNAERQALIELDLKVKEGMNKHLKDFLVGVGKVAINLDRFETLTALERDFETKLKNEISKTTKELNERYAAELNLKLAQINAERADDKAALKTLESRLQDANKNAEMWKAQLEAERSASVERSKASHIGTLNVSGGK